MGMWNGIRLNGKLDAVNLDKLVKAGKHAFNHAAKERRKALLTPSRGKTPYVVRAVNLESPGAEFYIWNEANPLTHCRNASDPWYVNFFEEHTSVDVFTQRATEILKVRIGSVKVITIM